MTTREHLLASGIFYDVGARTIEAAGRIDVDGVQRDAKIVLRFDCFGDLAEARATVAHGPVTAVEAAVAAARDAGWEAGHRAALRDAITALEALR